MDDQHIVAIIAAIIGYEDFKKRRDVNQADVQSIRKGHVDTARAILKASA